MSGDLRGDCVVLVNGEGCGPSTGEAPRMGIGVVGVRAFVVDDGRMEVMLAPFSDLIVVNLPCTKRCASWFSFFPSMPYDYYILYG